MIRSTDSSSSLTAGVSGIDGLFADDASEREERGKLEYDGTVDTLIQERNAAEDERRRLEVALASERHRAASVLTSLVQAEELLVGAAEVRCVVMRKCALCV
jgi:hypothetical protein